MQRTKCLHVCLHIDWNPYGTFNLLICQNRGSEMASRYIWYKKFPGGACPRTPLDRLRTYGAQIHLPPHFLKSGYGTAKTPVLSGHVLSIYAMYLSSWYGII